MATSYQQGLEDGFIDAIIVTQPQNTGGHTYEKFLEVLHKYTCAVYHNTGSLYYIAYGYGFDAGADYLSIQDKQYQHNWMDISTWDSNYKTELCISSTCTCGGSTRRKLRYSNDEWEYFK